MTREPDSGGGRSKLDGNAVDAVALIGRRLEAFSLEHMAQMPTASCACDLYPPTIRVRRPVYGSSKSFEEGRPATAGVEFGGGLVQGRSAANAVVRPVTVELVVLACSRQLGALEAEDAELLGVEDGAPLLLAPRLAVAGRHRSRARRTQGTRSGRSADEGDREGKRIAETFCAVGATDHVLMPAGGKGSAARSEERRVGKECRN